jgi:hypothetical protein
LIAPALHKLGTALQQLGHRRHPVYVLGRKIGALLKDGRGANPTGGGRQAPTGLADLVKAFAGYRPQ